MVATPILPLMRNPLIKVVKVKAFGLQPTLKILPKTARRSRTRAVAPSTTLKAVTVGTAYPEHVIKEVVCFIDVDDSQFASYI
ncbi:hypothetical protein SLEP1_g891 [Rubroshorea leprosula]|uniref:Uncharacterized protein n=1 Tax=Rubroshorea leprosula TaxID=152421 RepID=A0AAV5HHP4_9ROSI|nr:hypothetical protein SLEP1_g891 [Rubroshorea leprosula]